MLEVQDLFAKLDSSFIDLVNSSNYRIVHGADEEAD